MHGLAWAPVFIPILISSHLYMPWKSPPVGVGDSSTYQLGSIVAARRSRTREPGVRSPIWPFRNRLSVDPWLQNPDIRPLTLSADVVYLDSSVRISLSPL